MAAAMSGREFIRSGTAGSGNSLWRAFAPNRISPRVPPAPQHAVHATRLRSRPGLSSEAAPPETLKHIPHPKGRPAQGADGRHAARRRELHDEVRTMAEAITATRATAATASIYN